MVIEEQQGKLYNLILAIQASDEQAFSEFYDLLVSKIYALSYRMLNNTSDAEEVVSDVFTQIWQQARNYNAQKANVIAWTLMFTRSRSLDLIRKRKAAQIKTSATDEFVINIIDSNNEPERIIEMFQDNSRTHQLMASLSAKQRQLLALSFFRGLSHQEIANATNIPLGTVKSNIRKALIQLQSITLQGSTL